MKHLRVSVAGATGYLGTRVVTALRSRGIAVTAIVRNHADSPALRKLVTLGSTIAAVDAARDEPYEGALVGANVRGTRVASPLGVQRSQGAGGGWAPTSVWGGRSPPDRDKADRLFQRPHGPGVRVGRHLEASILGDQELPVGGPDILMFRDIGRLAAESLGRQEPLRFRTIPVGLLRALAVLAGAAGRLSRRLRRSAAILNWMIYVGTHDAIAPCVGERHLRDAFAAKRLDLDSRRPTVPSLMP